MHDRQSKMEAFGHLLDILDQLRLKCPWDKEQTFESLRPLSLEESYELSEALLQKDYPGVCKEIGDILLHLVFYSKIAEEQELFDIKDVCDQLTEKLIFRHPHVFGSVNVQDASEVEKNWEKLKLKEKNGNRSVLAGVPLGLPSLIKAFRMQDKARGVGFDWEEPSQVWAKVQEEINEFKQELEKENTEGMEDEFGDLLFSLVNVARLYGINPDNALERTNKKFRERFNYLETETLKKGIPLKELSLDQMEAIWQQAKKYSP
ncbi:MAG: nucleoside triphosphate pyrophosphohydrolase [Bacteroidales bacterium]|nr:nucleoside triphosphate pyrophosphohydrolase [Bacteroidales bacterium]MDD4641648.1 nucleoside triphosphate pyrophosphohydrolase [Bacteroidales bacterium]